MGDVISWLTCTPHVFVSELQNPWSLEHFGASVVVDSTMETQVQQISEFQQTSDLKKKIKIVSLHTDTASSGTCQANCSCITFLQSKHKQ